MLDIELVKCNKETLQMDGHILNLRTVMDDVHYLSEQIIKNLVHHDSMDIGDIGFL